MKQPPAQQVLSATDFPAVQPTATQPITLYHWLVVILAASGWLFDCMGQRVFVLSREPALRELLGANATDSDVRFWGGAATFLLMIGWATGGILFGLLSDKHGRVTTMVTTLLAYSLFSALSGFSHTAFQFLLYRFIFGLGVGGMFGAATTLVAESVPPHFRTAALGSMQALSAFGNMLASALSLSITPGRENFWGHFSGWQVLSFVSVFPAIMAVPMLLILKEPEAWRRAKTLAADSKDRKSVGSLSDLFSHPRWRKHLLVGVCLGVAGMVGLWGIGFFSPELITTAFKTQPLESSDLVRPEKICAALNTSAAPTVMLVKQKLSPGLLSSIGRSLPTESVPPETTAELAKELNVILHGPSLYEAAAFQEVPLKKATQNLIRIVATKPDAKAQYFLNRQLLEQIFPGGIAELQTRIDKMRSTGTFLQDAGGLLGMFAFTWIAARFTRRRAFLCAFLACLVVVSFVFSSLKTSSDVYWMLPLMGFVTLSVFAGYSIYFPEIFPTRLRGTGVGFCYNTVRYAAAPFPLLLGWLSNQFSFRSVAVAMCSVYLIGVVALLRAPETKGQPLPE